MKMSNVKKSLSSFLHGSRGFSLAEIMVAAGMLGVISVGVMQMMSNMQKGQKSIAINTEKESILYNVRMALRDKLACERTFANVSVGGVAPQNGTIVGNVAGAAAVNIPRIFSGGTVARVIATTLPNGDPNMPGTTEDNLYGKGTQGRILLETMQIVEFGAPYPGDNNRNWFKIRLTFLKGGEITTGGAVADKSSFGGARTAQDFDVQYVVTASPAAAPSTPNIGECFVEEAQYVDAACSSLGGTVNPSGECTNIVIRKQPSGPSPTYPELAIMNLGDMQVTRGLVVGDGTNDNTVLNYLTPIVMNGLPGGVGIGENSTGEGNLDIAHNISAGSNVNSSTMSGGAGSGNAAFGGSLAVGTGAMKGGTGHVRFTGDLSGAGSGLFGQLVTAENFVSILDSSGSGGQNLRVGDDTFFTDIDVANSIGIYGIQNPDRMHLQIGSGGGQKITGRSGSIGINKTNPNLASFGVTDLQLDVNGSIHWGSSISVLSSDQGGSLELGGVPAQTPYIDFKNDTLIDYDARIILGNGTEGKGDGYVGSANDGLSIQGAYLYVPESAGWGGGGLAGASHRVATRKYIENLLAANIDDTKWSNMMQDISEAVTGLALDESNMLEAIAQYVCDSIRHQPGAGVDSGTNFGTTGANTAWVAGGAYCNFTDWYDKVPTVSCGADEFMYYNNSGAGGCRKLPTITNATTVTIVSGNNWVFRLCTQVLSQADGDLKCARKRLFSTQLSGSSCCTGTSCCGANSTLYVCSAGWTDVTGEQQTCNVASGNMGTALIDTVIGQYKQVFNYSGGVYCVNPAHFLRVKWRDCVEQADAFYNE
ncbi:MAG: hypothetical protein A2X86_02250 [Bdellovibrionales bacterium GWA2_49_15]|nr:MAG: hypothetical protein A2X86_02250 [Bdellovibrionales bacterium GWA2_49_15]